MIAGAGGAGGAWTYLAVACLTLACTGERTDGEVARSAATGVTAPGPAARELLGVRAFTWGTTETAHLRVHTPSGSSVHTRVAALADSTEAARDVVLRLLGEPEEVAEEPKLEVFFVDTRNDMARLVRRPIAGFAQPGELTAAFVAGPGYRPFLRHELAHAYAAVRWGELAAGDWLTEGIGALAQGDCQGHSVDAIASGYAREGAVPPLRTLANEFRSHPELPSYVAAASAVDFVRRRAGIGAVRTLWRTPRSGGHPLGATGERVEAEWRRYLAGVAPATLDTVRLIRDGC